MFSDLRIYWDGLFLYIIMGSPLNEKKLPLLKAR